jgi:hypothetical protein
MQAGLGEVLPAMVMFGLSLTMTAIALWVGGRMAPWFLKERFEPPTVRSYFMQPSAESDLNAARVVTVLAAMAVLLAMLLGLAVAVKFGGVPVL